MSAYEEIMMIIAKERQARIRQRPDEIIECYFEDATIVTSWLGEAHWLSVPAEERFLLMTLNALW